ncbi:hypothetical protein PAPYR_6697 [Paratrimastix pyriformis]|uniref:Secreted protein n=1 Tax=Paratrimastix pyriformis TaxID=342808 RepID=A0ABQ8UEU9_9EUKA|nr:hypothetical protein PAPYR_6697 [Paratrimastix pyriformis]
MRGGWVISAWVWASSSWVLGEIPLGSPQDFILLLLSEGGGFLELLEIGKFLGCVLPGPRRVDCLGRNHQNKKQENQPRVPKYAYPATK